MNSSVNSSKASEKIMLEYDGEKIDVVIKLPVGAGRLSSYPFPIIFSGSLLPMTAKQSW